MPGSWNTNAHTALSSGAREFVPTNRTQPQGSKSLSTGAHPFAPVGPGASSSFPSSLSTTTAPASASSAPATWAMRAKLSTKASEFVPRGVANPAWVPSGLGNDATLPCVQEPPAPRNFVFDPNAQDFQPANATQTCALTNGTFVASQSPAQKPQLKLNPEARVFTPAVMPRINLGAFSDDESDGERQRRMATSHVWSASARAEVRDGANSFEAGSLSHDAKHREPNATTNCDEDVCHEPPVTTAKAGISRGGVKEPVESKERLPTDRELHDGTSQDGKVRDGLSRSSEDADDEASQAEADAETPTTVPQCSKSSEGNNKPTVWAWRRNTSNRQRDNVADEAPHPGAPFELPRKASVNQGSGKPWLKKAAQKEAQNLSQQTDLCEEPERGSCVQRKAEQSNFEDEQEEGSTATTGTGLEEGSTATIGAGSEEVALMDGGVDLDDKSYNSKQLLLWHAVVVAEALKDESLHYSALAPAALLDRSEPVEKQQRESIGRNWRDDAAKAQKNCTPDLSLPIKSAGSRGAVSEERRPKTPKHLAVSPTSWVAQQQELRQARKSQEAESKSDTDIVREMKLILNKLTVEKFGTLYQQLIDCGISTPLHVEILMREVFEKATTQHHFIGMYAELCSQLHAWFIQNSSSRDTGSGDDGKVFKRILLNQCQVSFEQYLRPQSDAGKDESAETQEMAERRKLCMLGNLRFVGALLEKGMLASKILMAVVEELLADPTPVSLECCCVFLTAVGPTFDRPDWILHVQLRAAFQKVGSLSKDKSIPSRVRYLLQDVLDLRASQWQNKKKAVRTSDGPMTLDQVHRLAEEETGERIQAPPRGVVSGGTSRSSTQNSQVERRKLPSRVDSCQKTNSVSAAPFSKDKFRDEVGESLRQLASTRDVDATVEKFRAADVPADKQGIELAHLLSCICDQISASSRQPGFDLVAKLFLIPNGWKKTALVEGLTHFFGEIYTELKIDIPILPDVIREELAPALQRLVDAGLLRQTVCSELLTVS